MDAVYGARPVRASQTFETVDVVVIGGGVVGCAVLREVAGRGRAALLLEAEPDVGEGTSKANSAILHTGFDAKPGTIEARLLRRSLDLWPDVLAELGVPYLACGALMLARTDEEAARLADVALLSAANGVSAEILDRVELFRQAPYVTPDARAALHVPSEGIVDPFWLTRAYAEAAIAMGAQVRAGASVTGLSVTPDAVDITLAGGHRIRAAQAFDCGGLWADEIAALAGDTSFRITPRKGQFLISERTYDVDRIVLPIPGLLGKGMLVTPIVFGGVLLGPTAEDGADKTDRSTDETGRQRILEACRGLVPNVDQMDPIRRFAGVRGVSSTGDYVVRPSTAGDRLTIVAGIRSTGISASPAIAEAATDLAAAARGWDAGSRRRMTGALAGPELAPDAGPVVCVCRSVGAAEVDAALHGPLAAATVDAVKRRCGAGFGDCQGNRCAAEVIGRIGDARGVPAQDVEKGLAGSWLVGAGPGPGAGEGPHHDAMDGPLALGTTEVGAFEAVDLAVVGGGLAGIGAALAAAEAGRSVLVLDRGRSPGGALAAVGAAWWRDGERAAIDGLTSHVRAGRVRWVTAATVVGLADFRAAWEVDVQLFDRAETVTATAVVLATGGYVTPRDHLRIDGPRPSGIMTADFAMDALDRGWLPATAVIVVGTGRVAQAAAARLAAAGVRIVEQIQAAADDPSPILAVRGERRLEAVELPGRVLAVDGLVLAHAQRPAAFLLRGLGIGDDRPGVPMPAGPDGELPLPRLWAAGTCVTPDIDHGSSLGAGRRVGRTAAAALVPRPAVGAGR